MEKTYNPQAIETQWTQTWEQQDYYQPNFEQSSRYAITLPPPNVTGTLHMGHGFQLTLMDILIRRQRMMGKAVLWQPGTDHAGIATQMVVERELSKEKKSRHDLGRDAFIDRVWDWRAHSGSTITQQIRRMGASLEWSRERFSMDETLSFATNEAFIRLYNDKKIYRGKRLVNWDPKLNTAISDLEVINKESQGHLWHIRYPLSDDSGHVIVATTRPETMLGDTAVAVHPEDERYQHLIGQQISLPLTDRKIPIIADEEVDKTFGSGCVKITPAHDFNDYAMGKRHQLDMINVMTFDGHLNETVPAAYQGLERFAARKKVIEDLEQAKLIEKIEPHTLQLPIGDRSGVVIEPMLTDQWFVKTDELAQKAIDALESGDLTLTPKTWDKTYLQWLNNIEDWCISRQLWWGHRIPVWYDEQNRIYVGHDEAQVRKQYQLSDEVKLQQDEDVLDTWFTAALCPFSSLGWPEKTPDLEAFYPNNVLVTGFDIIFFWVARMVMFGLYFLKQVPFKTVYIHGLIRDSHGQKMSKSKGNVLDPIDLVDGVDIDTLIEKRTRTLMQPQMAKKVTQQTRKEFPEGIQAHGTDALRFTFCALASTGRDINFDMGRITGYRNFCNKLWNAARFVLMQVEDQTLATDNIDSHLSLSDKWILNSLNQTIEKANHYCDEYRFDLMAQCLYEFTWNEYCDWYLELSKCTLNHSDISEQQKNATRVTLLTVLENITRLLHPIIPFITESIWQSVAPLLQINKPSIMLEPYPQQQAHWNHPSTESEIQSIKNIIAALRNVRSEAGISPAKKIAILCRSENPKDQNTFNNGMLFIQPLAKLTSAQWISASDPTPVSATTLIDTLEIYIPLAGLIDKQQEMNRLDKEIKKLQKDLIKCQQKLDNPNYVNKAPAQVVAQERARLSEAQTALEKLEEHYSHIVSIE